MRQDTSVESVTRERLAAILEESDIPVVVDFWAVWCAPCRRLAPIFSEVATAMSDRARFVSVDVDAEPDLAERYAIVSIPTVTIFIAGRPVGTITGAVSTAHLTATLEAWLIGTTTYVPEIDRV